MKILVTGGSGFIGKNLTNYLISLGHEVLALGRNRVENKYVQSLILPEFTMQSIEKALVDHTFDAVINLAAAGVNPETRDVAQLLCINVNLPSLLLAVAVKCGAKAFITAGSSAEYVPCTMKAKIDEDFPLEKSKIYGASKASGGIMALATGKNLEIPVVITRLFNVFGPGEAPHRLLPCLINNLKNQKSVNLSTGLQIRDFIYVEDVCSGIMASLNALLSGKLDSGIYNISTGIGTTVAEFCKTTVALIGAKETLLNFGALPLRSDEYEMVVGDSTLIQNKTGWKPRFTVERGILEFLKFYGYRKL